MILCRSLCLLLIRGEGLFSVRFLVCASCTSAKLISIANVCDARRTGKKWGGVLQKIRGEIVWLTRCRYFHCGRIGLFSEYVVSGGFNMKHGVTSIIFLPNLCHEFVQLFCPVFFSFVKSAFLPDSHDCRCTVIAVETATKAGRPGRLREILPGGRKIHTGTPSTYRSRVRCTPCNPPHRPCGRPVPFQSAAKRERLEMQDIQVLPTFCVKSDPKCNDSSCSQMNDWSTLPGATITLHRHFLRMKNRVVT